jgi:hypothetical protein
LFYQNNIIKFLINQKTHKNIRKNKNKKHTQTTTPSKIRIRIHSIKQKKLQQNQPIQKKQQKQIKHNKQSITQKVPQKVKFHKKPQHQRHTKKKINLL